MTPTQRAVLIKLLYINVHEKNIFDVLSNIHREIGNQKEDLQNEEFSFNDEDVRCKFSVVHTDFRINHPKLYANVNRLISKSNY
jgi:hypothetical protein